MNKLNIFLVFFGFFISSCATYDKTKFSNSPVIKKDYVLDDKLCDTFLNLNENDLKRLKLNSDNYMDHDLSVFYALFIEREFNRNIRNKNYDTSYFLKELENSYNDPFSVYIEYVLSTAGNESKYKQLLAWLKLQTLFDGERGSWHEFYEDKYSLPSYREMYKFHDMKNSFVSFKYKYYLKLKMKLASSSRL
jgi:hypothetical protein